MNGRVSPRLVLGILLCFYLLPARAGDILLLGVQDYNQSPILVVREYMGLTRYLGRELGRQVRVESVRDYDEYLKKAAARRFAFLFAPPSMIMQAHRLAGYEPIAKIPGLLSASFMSLASSGIAFPEDMKGKRIGFTDKESMITELGLAQLAKMNIDPAKYFKSVTYYHDADGVLSALQYHLIDIGVANSGLFNAWTAKGYDINLVLQGKGVPHLTFAVRDDLPKGMKERVAKALLKADRDPDAEKFFKYSSFPNFEPATLRDYDGLVSILHLK